MFHLFQFLELCQAEWITFFAIVAVKSTLKIVINFMCMNYNFVYNFVYKWLIFRYFEQSGLFASAEYGCTIGQEEGNKCHHISSRDFILCLTKQFKYIQLSSFANICLVLSLTLE